MKLFARINFQKFLIFKKKKKKILNKITMSQKEKRTIAIIGDCAVGKSCLFLRYFKNDCDMNTESTKGYFLSVLKFNLFFRSFFRC